MTDFPGGARRSINDKEDSPLGLKQRLRRLERVDYSETARRARMEPEAGKSQLEALLQSLPSDPAGVTLTGGLRTGRPEENADS